MASKCLVLFSIFSTILITLILIPSSAISSASYSEAEKENCIGNGEDYFGEIKITETGKYCKTWPRFWSTVYPLADLKNDFCRNPNKDLTGPWCFTELNEEGKEYCEINCEDGFVKIKDGTRCKDRDEVPLQTNGSVSDCQELCWKMDDCDVFEYHSDTEDCSRCLTSSDLGVFGNGWKLMKRYMKPSLYILFLS
ncbi:hypothetical protein MHBO_000181 [Bonamia ostreae]|uniref:Kringle domain-containing protein n=1 Tax=Bonamia ostreae TaxID=126728 RepID=A0ABV2AEN7_9EUKA